MDDAATTAVRERVDAAADRRLELVDHPLHRHLDALLLPVRLRVHVVEQLAECVADVADSLAELVQRPLHLGLAPPVAAHGVQRGRLVGHLDVDDAPVLADPLSGVRFGGHVRTTPVVGGYDGFLDERLTEEWPDPDVVFRAVVRVRDEFGNPVEGVPVAWAIRDGGGSVSPVMEASDSTGKARALWSLGSPGWNMATATANDLTVEFQARGGTNVEGILSSDQVWEAEASPYRFVSDIVQVASGVSLTIRPGVTVEGRGGRLELFGAELTAVGDNSQPIKFNRLSISRGAGSSTNAVNIENAELINLHEILLDFSPVTIKHSVVAGVSFRLIVGSGSTLSHNEIRDVGQFRVNRSGTGPESYIEYNVIVNSGPLTTMNSAALSILHNSFYDFNGSAILLDYNYRGGMVIAKNNFWDTGAYGIELAVNSPYHPSIIEASENFWNTTDESAIQSMIYDSSDNLAIDATVEYTPFLSEPDPDAPTSDDFL